MEVKLSVKCINRIILGSKLVTGKKNTVSPDSGAIHKIYYGRIKTYSGGKYPTIEVYRWPHKTGNNQKHAENLVPINIISSCGGSGCTSVGRSGRHLNELK